MSQNFSAQETAQYKQAFDFFDKDGSGSISSQELSTAMKSLGYDLTQQQISTILNHVDADHSGQIDFNEFLKFIASARN